MSRGTLGEGDFVVVYMIWGDSNIFCEFMSSRQEALNNSPTISMSDAGAHIRRPGSYSLKLPSMAISQLITHELLRASKHCGSTYKIYYYPLKSFLNHESPFTQSASIHVYYRLRSGCPITEVKRSGNFPSWILKSVTKYRHLQHYED